MDYEITKEMREKANEILIKKQKGELNFISFEESKKRSLEYLEKLAKNDRKKASGE